MKIVTKPDSIWEMIEQIGLHTPQLELSDIVEIVTQYIPKQLPLLGVIQGLGRNKKYSAVKINREVPPMGKLSLGDLQVSTNEKIVEMF